MKPADLLQRHAAAWQTAIRHPFFDSVCDGTLDRQSFATWLVQAYLFVEDKLAAQAHLLPSAPRFARNLLIRHMTDLEAELTWFEMQAKKEKLSLDAARSPVTEAYGAFMKTFEQFPFAAALTATWAIERASLEACKARCLENQRIRNISNAGPAFALPTVSTNSNKPAHEHSKLGLRTRQQTGHFLS